VSDTPVRSALLLAAILLAAMPCMAGASVRLEGLGPNLFGIVDDEVADLLGYPQLNALSSDWAAGFDLPTYDFCHIYAKSPGPVSVAGVVTAEDWMDGVQGIPSIAVAASRARWAVGVEVTVADFQGMRSSPPFWGPGETTLTGMQFGWWSVGNANLGGRWSGDDFALDATVGADLDRGVYWRVWPDTFIRTGENYDAVITPALRLTLGRGSVRWRYMTACEYNRSWDDIYDTIGGRVHMSESWTRYVLSAVAGPEYWPNRNLFVAAALRMQAVSQLSTWSWRLRVPVGMEWNQGPWTLRLGAEASALLTTSGGLKADFERNLYFGLGIRPAPHVTIDLVPSLDDAANLRAWQLGVRADF
jgi:hypothetical protein